MSVETELASLKATLEERTTAIQNEITSINKNISNINNRLNSLACSEHKVRIDVLEQKLKNSINTIQDENEIKYIAKKDIDPNFVTKSIKFIWGVILLLWGAIITLFTLNKH